MNANALLYCSTDVRITPLPFSVLQNILGEFVTVEMAFHAKALEVYTAAYQHIKNVDEEADLEVMGLIQPCHLFCLKVLRIIIFVYMVRFFQ